MLKRLQYVKLKVEPRPNGLFNSYKDTRMNEGPGGLHLIVIYHVANASQQGQQIRIVGTDHDKSGAAAPCPGCCGTAGVWIGVGAVLGCAAFTGTGA